jgi:uncharacterized membrane protein YeaQ/YmgE (transglycosylase-associated protein family)
MIGHIIGWIIVGGILGALARFLVPGRDPMSIPATIVMGMLGELIAGVVFWALFGIVAGWLLGLLATVGLVLVSRRTGIGRRTTT